MCYKCFWPQSLCWCGSITPMPTRTKFVILMHPYEFKRIKANTGRLTHLCLADSELHVGIGFDDHAAVQALINDPRNYPVLLYPSRDALDLSVAGSVERGAGSQTDSSGSQLTTLRFQLESRRLVVFLLDATWRLVRPMLRTSLSLQRLPKIMFSHAAPSRYVIKRQPEPGCLSTLEAVHELLLALDRSGLDRYALPEQLLGLFQRMQDFQISRTAENRRLGIGRHARRDPAGSPRPAPRPLSKRRRIFRTAPPGPGQPSSGSPAPGA
ncbi:MAG: DTW domain-containing protein [Lacunisphaera sp.]|nr:DTW domain-containing protein [Lacunisphaera sp.]